MQADLLTAAGVAAAAAGGSAYAERRRARRRLAHGPGFMPWPTITFAATFAALVLLAYGLRAAG